MIKILLPVALTLGLLASCAQPNPHPMDMTAAVQSAKTRADHEALAAHYEQAAKDAAIKIDEHKQLLDQYKTRGYLYGKQALNFQSHCEAIIRSYQQIANDNSEMAKMHLQLAESAN
ncbi:MAG: hypothetical protein AB1648_02820 [Pseudomonadota bacterium]|jgi:hypothetical protein